MRGVKAAFVSLLVRREKAVVPSTEAGANKNGGILRSSQVYGDCEEPLEKLKEQWTQFMHETFLAIAELDCGVLVLLFRADGDNLQRINLQNGDRHVLSRVIEDAGHANLLGDETATHGPVPSSWPARRRA